MEYFRIKDAFSVGWSVFKEHFVFTWMVLAALVIYEIIVGSLQSTAGKETFIAFVIGVVGYLGSMFLNAGFTRIFIDLIDGRKDEFTTLFSQKRVYWRFVGATILFGLWILLGLVLLIIPAIYFLLKYQFVLNLVIDKEMPVMEAFKRSAEITDGVKWKLLGFTITLCLVNLLGALLLVVGLLVTVPVSVLASMYVYRKLSNRLEPVAVVAPETPVVQNI